MWPSSRTPEGEPLQCRVCGARHRVDVANPPGDSVCPSCGAHAWLNPSSDSIGGTEASIRAQLQDQLLALEASARETETRILDQVQKFSVLCLQGPPVIDVAMSLVGLLTSCLAAHGAILWLPTKRNWWSRNTTLRPLACFGESGSAEFAEEVRTRCEPILRDVTAAERDMLLIGVPISRDQRVVGVIEVLQRGGNPLATQRGYLRFVCQMAEIVAVCRSLPA